MSFRTTAASAVVGLTICVPVMLAVPTISVTHPNGGEVWSAGTTQNVTWTSSGLTGYVYIDLYKTGEYQSFVGYAPVSTGTFAWDICQYIGNGPDYTVVITGYDSLGQPVEDSSNAAFTITGSLPPPPAPTVTVTSPNGGESWPAGSIRHVTWTSTNPAGYVYVDLYKAGQYQRNLGYALMSAGDLTWNICSYIGDGTDYMVAVTGQDACGDAVYDFSNGSFTLTGSQPAPPLPTITVTSPHAGDNWSAGSTHSITWTSTNPNGSAYVDLYKGGQFHSYLGSAPMSDGTFSWSICPFIGNGTDYSMRITGYGACGEFVQSNDSGSFTISGSVPVPTVTVTSPNGGESWLAGTTQTITWTSTNPSGYVYVQLYKGGVYQSTLGHPLMSDGSMSWNICPTLGDGTNYTIKVSQSACESEVGDVGNGNFTITGSLPAPTMAFTSPTGGEIWPAGTQHNLTWTTTNPSGSAAMYLAGFSGQTMQEFTFIDWATMSDGVLPWTISSCEGRTSGLSYQIIGYYGCSSESSSGFFNITPVQIPADFNNDCHVDDTDRTHFSVCSSGPAVPYAGPACQDADLDHDNDVDQADFAVFQRCWSGPSRPVEVNCVN